MTNDDAQVSVSATVYPPPATATATAYATLNVVLPSLEASLTGTYRDPSVMEQLQAYYNSMSVSELMMLLATCWQCLNATLQDPEKGMYTTLILLPTLVLVLRAIRNKRGD